MSSTQEPEGFLHWVDIIIIIIYFGSILCIGLYFILQPFLLSLFSRFFTFSTTTTATTSSTPSNAKQFFLADKSVTFFAIGCSLFASNIGSEHFIGLSSSATVDGLSVSWGEWLSPWLILLLGWLFIPFYLNTGVYTLPEFLEKRYSRACRVYLSVMSLLLYVLTKISVALYAGNVMLKGVLFQFEGTDFWSTLLLILVTAVYTIAGGLKAVIYTEVIQTLVLISGGTLVLIFGLIKVGGWSGLTQALGNEPHLFHMFQPVSHAHFPWTGVLFGMPFTSLWYWATDQGTVLLCVRVFFFHIF